MSIAFLDVPSGFYSTGGVWGPAMPFGPPTVSFPLAGQNNYARIYDQGFIVHSGVDVTGAIGSAGLFPGTYLVSETDRAPLGAGLFTFNRRFAEIPSGFNDYETITCTFPKLQTYRDQSLTQTVVARIYNDFLLTASPQGLTLSGATRWRNVYGFDVDTLSAITTPTNIGYSGWVSSGTEILPQDSTVSRYIGPIWQRQTYYVKAQ